MRLPCRVKQTVQAMEICRRPKANIYDNLNQQSMVNFLPSSTAAGNITLTFNNNLNSLTSQVGITSQKHCNNNYAVRIRGDYYGISLSYRKLLKLSLCKISAFLSRCTFTNFNSTFPIIFVQKVCMGNYPHSIVLCRLFAIDNLL